MKKLDIATVVFGTLCLLGSATASAQAKVFWTTSGFFGPFNISEMSPAIPKEKHRTSRFRSACGSSTTRKGSWYSIPATTLR